MPVYRIACRPDRGRVRQRNEDSAASDPALGLVVVADGMGGHPAGDVASRIAADTVLHEMARATASSGEQDGGAPRDAGMAEAVTRAHHRILQEGDRDRSRLGMATTLTAFRLDGETGRWRIAHIGDSRAYRLRSGELERLTRDDTWVQEQVEAGRLTPDQAWRHPRSSELTRGLGLPGQVEPATSTGEARSGDLYLLCTDGLTDMLREREIAGVLRAATEDDPPDVEALADALVEAANERGGADNVTVALVAVG